MNPLLSGPWVALAAALAGIIAIALLGIAWRLRRTSWAWLGLALIPAALASASRAAGIVESGLMTPAGLAALVLESLAVLGGRLALRRA